MLCYKARVNKLINSGLCNLFLCHQSTTIGPSTTVSAVAPTECAIDCKKQALYIKICKLSHMLGFINAEPKDSELVI